MFGGSMRIALNINAVAIIRLAMLAVWLSSGISTIPQEKAGKITTHLHHTQSAHHRSHSNQHAAVTSSRGSADRNKPLFSYDDLLSRTDYPAGGYFHIYDPNIHHLSDKRCDHYYDDHNTMNFSTIIQQYKLWSGFVGQERMDSLKPNDTLFGLKHALDTIWKHQHPADCSSAKFLIPTKHNGGFGSELHVLANPLGLAMDLGRIYLSNPFLNEGSEWEVSNPFCTNQTGHYGFDCYYEPWSNCTVFDALGENAIDILQKWKTDKYRSITVPVIQIERSEIDFVYSDRYRQHMQRVVGGNRVAMIHMVHRLGNKYIPRILREVVECSPMIPKFHYYWWRAISMAYVMRPNAATRKWIQDHRMKALEDGILQNNTGAIYVRRGDKDVEMRLSPIQEYIDGLRFLWERGYIQNKSPRHVFLASESSEVIDQMESWGKQHASEYRIHYTQVFDRKGLFAEKTRSERSAGTTPKHHPEEYLSMLLNIHYLVQASGWVCTMSSNFCRIVDELRATVAARAGGAFMDLSVEKCTRPPCLYGGFYDLDW